MKFSKSSRRAFLQGIGAMVALPSFESLAATAKPAKPAKRLVICYTPNGLVRQGFFPGEAERSGSKFHPVVRAEKLKEELRVKASPGRFAIEWTPTMKPLEPLGENLSVVVGLDRIPSGDAHQTGSSCYLSSVSPDAPGPPQARTLDHMVADEIGGDTPFKSIEISCNGYHDARESAHFNNISWYDATRVAPSIRDPGLLYSRLFSQKNLFASKNITDLVLEDARYLNRRLSRDDQDKFAEYFEAMRSVEVRIEKFKSHVHQEVKEIEIAPMSTLPRGEYIRLMSDIMIVALQSGMTNVVTFMVAPERWDSSLMYEGVFDKAVSHHQMSHKQETAEGYRAVMKIDQFHMQQVGWMIERMAGVKEADGSTLLDNTLFHYGVGLGDGATHQYFDIPSIIAGGKNLGIRHGQYLRCEEDTPLANLWLTYAKLFGIKKDEYADSNGTIPEILV